jgi:hypothetical protein
MQRKIDMPGNVQHQQESTFFLTAKAEENKGCSTNRQKNENTHPNLF